MLSLSGEILVYYVGLSPADVLYYSTSFLSFLPSFCLSAISRLAYFHTVRLRATEFGPTIYRGGLFL